MITDIPTQLGPGAIAETSEATTTLLSEGQGDGQGESLVSLEATTAMDVDTKEPDVAATLSADPVLEEVITAEVESTAAAAEPTPSVPVAEEQLPPAQPVVQPPVSVETPKDPPPTPVATATEDAALPVTESPKLADEEMKDAPPSPTKNVRARDEEDSEDGPAAKRTRTEDEGAAAEFKKPELPPISTSTPVKAEPTAAHVPETDTETSRTLTKAQHKFLLSGIRNLKRTKDAQFFNAPVDPVKLNIPSYTTIIKDPMDLGTIETNLKNDSYQTVEAVVTDFNLIVGNTTTFNGPDHLVTRSAVNLKATFDRQLTNLPKADVVEPPSAEKKAKKAAASKAAPARRESRSSTGVPPSPAANAGSPTTFALGPSGTPLIRRDSTVGDGRPKREIHPPPPRDLPYTTSKPKKKKYVWELKFCQEILNELLKPKYVGVASPFRYPVDPVALNIPHYHKIVKKPIDMSTIAAKLKNGDYENAKEFEADMRLMFANCYRFNPPGDAIHEMGKQLETIFDEKWAQKKEWIDDHVPMSASHSAATSPEPEEDEDEEEEDDEDESNDVIDKLQQQIEMMREQVDSMRKKKASPGAKGKKSSKNEKVAKKSGKKSAGAKGADRTSISKSDKKKKAPKKDRTPYITYEQKQEISNRINTLPPNRMQTALKIIRDNMPNLKVSVLLKSRSDAISMLTRATQGIQDDELELDIDELSDEVLHKLYQFVQKYAPGESSSKPESKASRPKAHQESRAPAKPKKNKPMNKMQQEARISELQGKLKSYQNHGSDESPEPRELPRAPSRMDA